LFYLQVFCILSFVLGGCFRMYNQRYKGTPTVEVQKQFEIQTRIQIVTKKFCQELRMAIFALPKLVLTQSAKVAHLVEHDLAKVGVAGSSPVFRSEGPFTRFGEWIFLSHLGGEIGRHAGLKILFAATRVRVQVPPGALSLRLREGIFFAIL
jgi:hypothetical protein